MKKYRWNKKKFLKNIGVFLGITLLALFFDAMFIYALLK